MAFGAVLAVAVGAMGAIALSEELEVCHGLTRGAADFTDALPEVHRGAIDCLAHYGVAQGQLDGTFGPGQQVTRGQAASLLARAAQAAGLDAPTREPGENRFHDDDGSVHEAAIEAVADYGILLGRPDGGVEPNGHLTRGQAASMAIRTLQVAVRWVPSEDVPDAFDDDDGSVHERALNLAADLGILRGTGPRQVSPNATLTRAQAATLLANVMDVIVAEGYR